MTKNLRTKKSFKKLIQLITLRNKILEIIRFRNFMIGSGLCGSEDPLCDHPLVWDIPGSRDITPNRRQNSLKMHTLLQFYTYNTTVFSRM